MNARFPSPLSGREVAHVVAHVERYRAGWEARGWHRPSWLARQAARGRKGGLKGGPASGAARRARTAERDRAMALEALTAPPAAPWASPDALEAPTSPPVGQGRRQKKNAAATR